MEAVIVGAIAGVFAGLLGGLAVLVFALLQKPKTCPECDAPLPKFRQPANRRQMLWGGCTCPECGCELDRRGRRIEDEDD